MPLSPQIATQERGPTESDLSWQVHGEMLLSTLGRTQEVDALEDNTADIACCQWAEYSCRRTHPSG